MPFNDPLAAKEYQRNYAARRSAYKAEQAKKWRENHPNLKEYTHKHYKKDYEKRRPAILAKNKRNLQAILAVDPGYLCRLAKTRYAKSPKEHRDAAKQRRLARIDHYRAKEAERARLRRRRLAGA